MSRNGSGTYSLPEGNPVVSGTTITTTWANTTLSDIATALTNSIAKDGQTTPTANLPMGTYKHTGVAVAAALTDYARADQVQNSSLQYLTSVSGVDTITASASITPSAYAAGQTFRFVAAGDNTGAATLNVSSLGAKAITKNGTTALAAGDIVSGKVITVTYDGTAFQLVEKIAAPVTYDNSIQDFRLTLTTGTPVTTTDVTGATIIYCTPYKGNRIALYDGSSWNMRTSAEFSLALGTLTSGLPYDVFCYDNAGTPTLEFTAWTNSTTRATALAVQDGVLVKSGAPTRRYLGTFYTTSATTTSDSGTMDGTNGRHLWNYYHRRYRKMLRKDSTATWTYTTATWRQANAAAANKLLFVIGVSEDSVFSEVLADASNSDPSGVSAAVSIGLDSTTAPSADALNAVATLENGREKNLNAKYVGYPGVGAHSLVWLEYSAATGTATWYGVGNTATLRQTGIFGQVLA